MMDTARSNRSPVVGTDTLLAFRFSLFVTGCGSGFYKSIMPRAGNVTARFLEAGGPSESDLSGLRKAKGEERPS